MQISFQKILGESNGTLVLGVFEEKVLTRSAQIIDSQIQGTLKRAIEKSSFTGKKDEILSILAPHGISNSQVLLVGLGNPKGSSPLDFQQLGGKIIAALSKCQDVQVIVDIMDDKIRQLPEMVANVAAGMNLRSWKFDKYKTKKKEESSLKELIFITPEPAASEKAFEPLKHVAEGVALTRHVVSEPPNILYPESMAEIASELKRLKVGVEVLDEKHMKKLGMGALLGVGQGSIRESKLIVLEWMHGPKDRFKPQAMIDLATLTGAISVALGWEYAGLFSNNDELSRKLTDAGNSVGEKLWRLPMGDSYDKDIDSDIADVKNTGSGRGAGSITAAQFLQRFVNNVPWAHLDIADY
eukprot:gene15378-15518_t